MKRSVLLVVLALIALLAGVAWWFARGGRVPTTAPTALRCEDANEQFSPAVISPDPVDDARANAATTEPPSALGAAVLPSVDAHTQSAEAKHEATAAVHGRVITASGTSPAGLSVALFDKDGTPRVPIVLAADGAFAFDQLAAGRVWLTASGLDDVVWLASRKELRLRPGERVDLTWDLSDRQPCIVDVELVFDGAPSAGVATPLLEGLETNARVRLGTDGRGTWRTVHEGKLSFHACNFEPDLAFPTQALPSPPRIGSTGVVASTRRGARLATRIAIDTSEIRIVRDEREPMTRLELVGAHATISVPTETDLAGAAIVNARRQLLDLPLETTASTLAMFRAGSGTYELAAVSREGFWTCSIEVGASGAPLDARLTLARPFPR